MIQLYKNVDGVEVPLTAEEQAIHEANQAHYNLNAAKIQWDMIRNKRNSLLVKSDWTQLPDAPVDVEAWTTYRQALRDITLQADPFDIQWPVQPT